MSGYRYGITMAVKEHLAEGKPISRLEALALYGVANLPDVVSELRKQGWVIESRRVPFAKAVTRVNEYAVFHPPKNLPVKEIQLTEYWMSL